LEFHPEDVIISLINIVVLFILLRLILWKHVIRFLTERANRVQQEKDDIEKTRLETENLRTEYNDKLETIDDLNHEMMRKNREVAEKEAESILNEAREKSKQLIVDAQSRIEEEKESALEEVKADVTQLATRMAAEILKREVSANDNSNTVDDFFGNFTE